LSEENIFDQRTPEDQSNDTQATQFQIPTDALDFVGEGKKYGSIEDALKSVPHAQKHIQTLESELAQTKEELAKRRAASELLDEIKSGLLHENTPQAVEFDQDKLVQIVDQTLMLKEKQRAAQQNAVSVANKFTEQYGEKAQEVYNNLAKETGMSVQELNTLAARSPSVILKLAGLTKTETIPTKTSGSVNTETLNSGNSTSNLSARVPKGATTKDLVSAWKAAGEKVKQQISTS
jgi:hypothetical protein